MPQRSHSINEHRADTLTKKHNWLIIGRISIRVQGLDICGHHLFIGLRCCSTAGPTGRIRIFFHTLFHGRRCEPRRVLINAYARPARVVGEVVHALWNRLPDIRIRKVMHGG